MSGTFIPVYGLNNVFGQIPIFGQLLGGGVSGPDKGVNLLALMDRQLRQ